LKYFHFHWTVRHLGLLSDMHVASVGYKIAILSCSWSWISEEPDLEPILFELLF
jgi:hypothetical protein